MKKFILLVTLIFSSLTMAHLEHKSGEGEKPKQQQLKDSRGCLKQMEMLGCGHPLEEHDHFVNCLETKQEFLSHDCKILFERLYK